MKTYQVMIPFNRNADSKGRPGKPYLQEGKRWEEWLLNAFGGFTRLPVSHGVWRDPATGAVYSDAMIPYQVAVGTDHDHGRLTSMALKIFDDQLAIYTTYIGASFITDRGVAQEAAE